MGRLDRFGTDLKFNENYKEGETQPKDSEVNQAAYFKKINGQVEYSRITQSSNRTVEEFQPNHH